MRWDGVRSEAAAEEEEERQSDDDSFRCSSSSPEDEFISDYNEIECYEWYYFPHPHRYYKFERQRECEQT